MEELKKSVKRMNTLGSLCFDKKLFTRELAKKWISNEIGIQADLQDYHGLFWRYEFVEDEFLYAVRENLEIKTYAFSDQKGVSMSLLFNKIN